MSPVDRKPGPPAPRVRRRRIVLAAVVTAALAGGLWRAARPAPEKLLKQALAAARDNPVEGERLLRRVLASAAGPLPDARLALCRLLGARDEWDEALALFADVERSACRSDLLLDFASVAQKAGRRPAALAALGEVRQRGTAESVAALELLMSDYRDWEQHAELIDAARELTRLEPDNSARWIELVDLLAAMHRDDECIETLRAGVANTALPVEPRRELRNRLIDRLIEQRDAAAAREELIVLRNEEGRSLRVRANEIDIDRLEGNLDKALDEVAEVFPQIERHPEAYLTRGGILLDLGRYAEAASDLERAVAGRPSNESIHFKLSEAYRGLGRHEAARDERAAAADIAEKRSRIARLLQDLVNEPQNAQICREIADLHRQLDEIDAARRWERRAAKAASPAFAR